MAAGIDRLQIRDLADGRGVRIGYHRRHGSGGLQIDGARGVDNAVAARAHANTE